MSAPRSAATPAGDPSPEKLSGVALTIPTTCGWSSRTTRSPSRSGARAPISRAHIASVPGAARNRASIPATGTSSAATRRPPSTTIHSTAENHSNPPASRATCPSSPNGASTNAVGRR